MENEDSTYSNNWIAVKYTPRKMVTSNASWDLVKSPSISAWCAHVTLTPEESKIIVFIKGTLNGSKESTPIGGHKHPNSTLGDSLL